MLVVYRDNILRGKTCPRSCVEDFKLEPEEDLRVLREDFVAHQLLPSHSL